MVEDGLLEVRARVPAPTDRPHEDAAGIEEQGSRSIGVRCVSCHARSLVTMAVGVDVNGHHGRRHRDRRGRISDHIVTPGLITLMGLLWGY
jgi:hypothetical protein